MDMEPSVYDSLSRDAASAAASLSAMLHNDRGAYACGDYLCLPSRPVAGYDDSCATVDAAPVSESDRLRIVDRCYDVADKLDLDRETVVMAVDLTDRFLATGGPDHARPRR